MAASVFRNAEEGGKLVSGNTRFALALYKKLANSSENVFFSPGSISVAMAMTFLGARNKTAEEMRESLCFSGVSDTELHPSFADLHAAFHQSDADGYTFQMANRLFAEQSFEFVQSFVDATQKHYKSGVAPVDFKRNPDAATKEINTWVEDNTGERIKKLIADGVLDEMTTLVLVNAIYFKGNWSSQFKADQTKEDVFHLNKEEKVPVQMMYQKAKFRCGYQRELECKALELPYVNKSMSMIILLPRTVDGLRAVEQGLTSEILNDLEGSFFLSEMETHVWVPKFKMEESFDLNEALKGMGIKQLFDSNCADLSGIDSKNQLYVSKVLHKAFLEVNEEGSEAAAATAVKVMSRMMPMVNEIRVDHPFLFIIRENSSKSILFFGRFSKP